MSVTHFLTFLTSVAFVVGAVAILPPAHAAPFQDPLNTVAQISRIAAASTLTAVTRADDRLVAVGPHGQILISDDQGKHWRQVPAPTSVDLVAVYFPSAKKGWAVGHGGVVLHTEDGGQTWRKQFDGAQAAAAMLNYYKQQVSPSDAQSSAALVAVARQFVRDGAIHPFLDVWFENEQSGFVVGPFNLIFRTEDGGTTWTPWFDRTENPKGMNLNVIRGQGGEVYIAGESGLLLKLDRAKQRFLAVRQPYKGCYFGLLVTPQAVVVFGMRGNIFRSTDGCQTWQKAEVGENNGLMSGAVLDDGRLVIAGLSGIPLVSSDGGVSFSRLSFAKSTPIFGVAPAGKEDLAVVGIGGVRVEPLKQ